MSETKPRIAVMLGDPSGVGPELVAKLGSPGYRYRDMAEIIREYDELQKSNRSSL